MNARQRARRGPERFVRNIAERLSQRIEALCRELLPKGRRIGAEWVEARTKDGGLGDSLQIHLRAPKRGIWAHFAAGRGGDALDLVAYLACHDDKGEAIQWARRWLEGDQQCSGARKLPPRRDISMSKRNADCPAGAAIQGTALRIWREAQPAPGTTVEWYLRARGIAPPIQPTIRYTPNLRYSLSGHAFHAMVAAVQAPNRRVIAVHRTYILPDGRGKAPIDNPKMTLGLLRAGAVRLGPVGPVLGLAEGIETALSAMQKFDLPTWAALGSRLASVALPPEVREVHLFGDNGKRGHEAAEKAANAFTAQGRRVVLRFPPNGHGDWNDALQAELDALRP